MKPIVLAFAAAALLSTPAWAEDAPAPSPSSTAKALSATDTPVNELIKNPQAKAALEKALPEISAYYEQIGAMTLAQVAPMSQGAIDDAKLKEIQAELDKIR
jgi:hypothetical protein